MHSRSSLSRHGAVMALCAIGLFAEPALAQGQQGPPSTKGFSVGTQMTLASRQAVDGPLNGQPGGADGATRIGGGASVAYGITEWLTLYMNGDGAEAEEDRVLAFGHATHDVIDSTDEGPTTSSLPRPGLHRTQSGVRRGHADD